MVIMRYRRTSLAEDLMMAPWWVSIVVCAIGNIVIWLIIPEYLEANRPGGVMDGMLVGGYAGAQLGLSKMFILAMAIVFVFSLVFNFVLKKRQRF
jgi:hypothetical protein